MRRNSGYFRGVIVSITGGDSKADFINCRFNNNNGMVGGLFYVSDVSEINVYNSTIFDNFSVRASVAYIENQGHVNIANTTISRNKAFSVGGFQIFDSTENSILSNVTITENNIATASLIRQELDDRTICIYL